MSRQKQNGSYPSANFNVQALGFDDQDYKTDDAERKTYFYLFI